MMVSSTNPRKDRDRTGGLAMFQSGPALFLQQVFTGLAVAFSTPLESLLRHDFGERHYTRANYVSGIISMFFWLLIVGGLSWLFSGEVSISLSGIRSTSGPSGRISGLLWSLLMMLFGGEYSSYALFGGLFYLLMWLHILCGLYHFFRMWYRSRTGQALHSYDSGRSHLKFVTRRLFGPVNAVANVIVVVLAQFMPSRLKRNRDRLTPVFKHEELFTQLYVEPAVGIALGILYMSNGFGLLGMYFVFAGFGLGYITKIDLLAADGYMLDMRDQLIDQTFMGRVKDMAGEHHYAEKKAPSSKAENAAWQMAKMAESNPAVFRKLKKDNASLAEMMQNLNPKLRDIVDPKSGNGVSDEALSHS